MDTTPPEIGIVEDGSGLHDVIYSSAATSLSAFWHGFYDDESFITSYNVCFTLDPESDETLACESVISNRISVTLDNDLDHSKWIDCFEDIS